MIKADKKYEARDLLENFELSITTARLKVLSIIISVGVAVSISSIKRRTNGMSRITLYKTLKTLEKKGAIYKLFDLRGIAYYALGRLYTIGQQRLYVHFNCSCCHKMLAPSAQELFTISLPRGFKARMLALCVWGKCGKCAKKSALQA